MKRIRPRVLRHRDVCAAPYDVFSAVVETRHWAFGVRVHNWRDRWPAPNEWGLRIEFWRWHLCFSLSSHNAPAFTDAPSPTTQIGRPDSDP